MQKRVKEMINPFEKVVIANPPEENIGVGEQYIYLFCMFENKSTEKIKSLHLEILTEYILNNYKDIIYFRISSKTADASQYEVLE